MLYLLLCLSSLIVLPLGALCADSCIQATETRMELFKIEKATLQSNLNQIVDTINLAYQKQPFNRQDYPRITVAALRELLQNRENQLYIVVSDKNEVCGTVLLHGAEISLLSVHPHHQGQGLGLHLLQYVEQEAFKTYDNVFLKVIPLFQERLIRYYESAGYKSLGEYEPLSQEKLKRIQEQYHPEVFALIMRKENPIALCQD